MLMGGVDARAASSACDRACLTNLLTQYLNAVVKHDPSAAPLFIGFRQTENAVVVLKGEGVWKSVTALGKVQRLYVDPVQSSAGYFGTIEEGSDTGVATLRLKIENRKITEAEWVIGRKDTGTPAAAGLGSTKPEGLEPCPPPDMPLAKDQRSPRDVMLAVANSYYDATQTGNMAIMMISPGGAHLENGVGTCDRSLPNQGRGGRGRGAGGPGAAGVGAAVGVPPGGRGGMGIAGVVARRYPIVDEEKGVVLCMVIFMRPPGSPNRRNLLTEWFVIREGKISGVYAAMDFLSPTTAAPNWPPYDGNWPLPPTLPGMGAAAAQGGQGPGAQPPAAPGPADAAPNGRGPGAN